MHLEFQNIYSAYTYVYDKQTRMLPDTRTKSSVYTYMKQRLRACETNKKHTQEKKKKRPSNLYRGGRGNVVSLGFRSTCTFDPTRVISTTSDQTRGSDHHNPSRALRMFGKTLSFISPLPRRCCVGMRTQQLRSGVLCAIARSRLH